MAMDRVGNVRVVAIEDEMRTAYIDYAMSVIVARALPDVRDGLKPVHRRILYTMQEMGLRSTAAYRKCAGVVGEVRGADDRLIAEGRGRYLGASPTEKAQLKDRYGQAPGTAGE